MSSTRRARSRRSSTVSRFVDHQPWYRQSAILRREGVHIDRDVMSRWARKLAWLLAPLGERLLSYVLEAPKIHGDETPVTLLGGKDGLSGKDGSHTAYFWVYLHDGRSSGDMSPPAAAFRFTTGRGGEQGRFSGLGMAQLRKQTRRAGFLDEMTAVVPWDRFEQLIRPHYPVAGRGRRPYPLRSMLKIHFMQQWFGLSDPALDEALWETPLLRQFAGISLDFEGVPDETTILKFRHLLEKHELSKALFDEMTAILTERQIRRGVHRSLDARHTAISCFIEKHNADPKPVRWTKSADDILASIERFCVKTCHNELLVQDTSKDLVSQHNFIDSR